MLSYFVQWEILKETPVFDVFYVQPPIESIEGQQSVVFPVEGNGLNPSLLTVFIIIGRGRLDPLTIDKQIGKPVIGEEITPSLFEKRWGNDVLPYFCESKPGRDMRGARQCNEQHCLLDTVALSLRDDMTCLEIFRRRSW